MQDRQGDVLDKPPVTKTQTAVIYARVSGAKQVREGDGLASQERRCREYAAHHGYAVKKVFADDITGKLKDRPAMTEMLTFLRKHKRKGETVVIIDDISRFARDLRAHLELRSMLANAGGLLESPSIEFGEDSDSLLIENLLASVAQHQREKNGEQTVNRMKARMMNGYWCFQAPVGYKYARVGHHGKLLVKDEPLASIVQDVMEGYASGRFESMAEIKRLLETQPLFPKGANGYVPQQRVTDVLTQSLYAGYISHKNWNLHLVKGHHEPLVSLETLQKIQDRRNGNKKAPARKDLNKDFPLRGFVQCGDCEQPLTACWSKGEYKSYAYYLCDTKGCASYRKSIRRDTVESEFESILQSIQPKMALAPLVRRMLNDVWDWRQSREKTSHKALAKQLKAIEKQVDGLVERIVETSNLTVIKAYEAKIEKLETQKALITEKLEKSQNPAKTFEETIERASAFLVNPWNLWVSGELAIKRLVLKLAFKDRITYQRGEGYRTPELSLPFKALRSIADTDYKMVPPARLELASPKATDFKSAVFTDFTKGADRGHVYQSLR